ncbi:MAG: hypothetical protein WBA74_26065 [Cyclobacteriaceae bacterium]
MAKKIYISAIIGGIIVIGIYYFLGGFKDAKIMAKEPSVYRVTGHYFYGRYDDRSVREYFMSAKDELKSGKLEGDLCVVAFKSDTLQDEYISQFIGVVSGSDRQREIPEGFEERVYQSENIAYTILDMHPMARPNPEDIQDKLSEFMKNEGWEKPNLFLEIYKPDNSLIIHAMKE